MGKIRVAFSPEKREEYVRTLGRIDGFGYVQEDPDAAYCPISMNSVPPELQGYLASRQKKLREILASVKIRAHDPSSTPGSPDLDPSINHRSMYPGDVEKLLGARFFVGHNILPSDGKGVEVEKARTFNRIAVMLMDGGIRVSRMLPSRVIYLQYENFEKQAGTFREVFRILKQYQPTIGFNGEKPALIGIRGEEEPVDLEELVYALFPQVGYVYDGGVPILELKAKNPELFYEHNPFQKSI